MMKQMKSSRRRRRGMNEKLVEQAMRKMSPSAFHKMLAFLEAMNDGDIAGAGKALLGMAESEMKEVVEVVKLALGEEEVL